MSKILSRKFCLLPQGFSNAIANDCERKHRHLNLREVKKLEGYGEIEYFDLHPVTKNARYIRRDFKTYSAVSTQISKNVIMAAAGAYKIHPDEIRTARIKVKEHGKENREFLGCGPREIVLPGLKWNDQGMLGHFDSDGSSVWFDAQPGYPVKVILRPRINEVAETATQYRQYETLPKLVRPEIKRYLRERKAALNRLDRYWPEICEEILAGPYSEELNSLHGSELPSMLFDKILNAYFCS